MKPAVLLLLASLGVAGCTGYQPSKANCFDRVTRTNNSMAFLPSSQPEMRATVSTKSVPCTFTALGGPGHFGDG